MSFYYINNKMMMMMIIYFLYALQMHLYMCLMRIKTERKIMLLIEFI